MLRRTPLRVKLVAAVLTLVTVALIVISVASTVALRSYLVGRVDAQLEDTTRRVLGGQYPVEAGTGELALPSDFVLAVLNAPRPMIRYDPRYEHELPQVPTDAKLVARRAGDPYTASAAHGDRRWRMLVTMYPDQTGRVLVVAQQLADVDHAVTRLVWIELLVGMSALILLASLGAAIVRKSLKPLGQIENTAAAIAAGDLTQRVPDPEPGGGPPRSELGGLAQALNSMLSQIETAFTARAASEAAARSAEAVARDAAASAQTSETRARRSEERMRQFIADASHELRTPLTSIRGFAELYRQGAVSGPGDTVRLLRRIEDEASRMGLLVEDLLLLARLDRERPLALAPIELPVIAADSVQAARVVDPDRPIRLAIEPAAGPLVVRGDDARLRQVVNNLLTNALTHTPAGTPVTVRLRSEPGVAVVEVADQGPGLTPEQAERVFERFYRVDAARSRPAGSRADRPQGGGAGGTGLGLAIVAALVAAHSGTVDVDSTPGKGATFRVRLPLAAEVDNTDTADSQHTASPVEGRTERLEGMNEDSRGRIGQ